MDSFVCLSEDDKNIGATIINFGAHNTSMITFKNGCLMNCCTQNIGSSYITFDIAHAFGNSLIDAEKTKLMFASLILNENDHEKISLKLDNQKEDILIRKSDFFSVIIARQEEIIENIIYKNNESDQVISERKIIMTGGGSKIAGLINMLSEFIPCRLIKTIDELFLSKIENEFKDLNKNEPSLSTIFGSIKYIYQLVYEQYTDASMVKKNNNKNRFKSLFSIFRTKV